MTTPVTAYETDRRRSALVFGALAGLFLISAWSATFILTEENQMMFSTGILVCVWLFSRSKKEAGDFNRVVVIVLGLVWYFNKYQGDQNTPSGENQDAVTASPQG